VGASWKAVLRAADAAIEHGGWLRSPDSSGQTLKGRYLKEVGDGFVAVVHLDPGGGSTISPDGELTLGQGVEVVVCATYVAEWLRIATNALVSASRARRSL